MPARSNTGGLRLEDALVFPDGLPAPWDEDAASEEEEDTAARPEAEPAGPRLKRPSNCPEVCV